MICSHKNTEIRNVLIIGDCGSGKTWVLKNLIEELGLTKKAKSGLIRFRTNGKIAVTGEYSGKVFDGSDRLSMAVSLDFNNINSIIKKHEMLFISEGDRFTNKNFIEITNPLIIRIKDNGEKGRILRKSAQSEKQIKSINTRINKIKPCFSVENSEQALELIREIIKNEKI
jgi:hypothetical protein